MNRKGRASFSVASASSYPAVRDLRMPGNHFVGDQIPQFGKFTGRRDRYIRFRMAIGLDNKGIVVINKQSNLTGAVQSYRKTGHDVILDITGDGTGQSIEIIEVVGNRP